MINIIFFASYREQSGHASLKLPVSGCSNVRDLVAVLRDRLASRGGFLDDPKMLVAINQQMAGLDTLVADGDELAFFPPVTGG